MADKPSAKTKRVVKNPETFRERALKAADEPDSASPGARAKAAGSRVTGPLAQAARSTAGFKPLKPVTVPLRFIGKIIFPAYLRQSWQELRQVTWPTLRESRQLTIAVLIFAAAFGVIIAVVDFGLDRLFRDILLK